MDLKPWALQKHIFLKEFQWVWSRGPCKSMLSDAFQWVWSLGPCKSMLFLRNFNDFEGLGPCNSMLFLRNFVDFETLGFAKAYLSLGISVMLMPWALQKHAFHDDFKLFWSIGPCKSMLSLMNFNDFVKPWALQKHVFPKEFQRF